MKSKLAWLLLFFALVSCGEKKPEPTTTTKPQPDKPKIKVYQIEATPLPAWYFDDDAVVKKEEGDTQSFLYLKLVKEAPEGNKAVSGAKADAKGMAAEMIHAVVSSEMVKATEGMLNDKGEMDEYFSQTIALIAQNVDTGGLIPAGQVVEHLAREVPGKSSEEFYRATLRFKMPFELFENRIIEAMNKNTTRLNESLKGETEKVKTEITESLDETKTVIESEKSPSVSLVQSESVEERVSQSN